MAIRKIQMMALAALPLVLGAAEFSLAPRNPEFDRWRLNKSVEIAKATPSLRLGRIVSGFVPHPVDQSFLIEQMASAKLRGIEGATRAVAPPELGFPDPGMDDAGQGPGQLRDLLGACDDGMP